MRSVGRFLGVGVVVLCIGATVSRADEDTNQVPQAQAPEPAKEHASEPATIEAEQLRIDRANNMAYGDGHVVIQYKGATLTADHVRYNTETKDTWAEGNVRVNHDGQEWMAPTGYYNFNTGAFQTDKARGFVDPVWLQTDHLQQIRSNMYSAVRLTLSPCDYDDPHLEVQAKRAEIYPGDHITLHDATLRIDGVPCFWTPILSWSLKDPTEPLTLSGGNSTRWGVFVLTTTHWRVNDNVSVDVKLDQRTLRGFGSGADVNYRFDGDVTGSVGGYFISDKRPDMSLDETSQKEIPTSRYYYEWQHKQFFPNDIDVTVNLEKQSDSVVMEDFFPRAFRENSEPDSVADVTKLGDSFMLSALVRPQFNDFFAVVNRLPEVKLDVNRTQLGPTPLYYESESSAGYYNNDPGDTGDPLFQGSSIRADTFHQLVLPQVLLGWLSVVPRAGARYTFYSRAPDTADETNDVSRFVGDVGTTVSLKISRTWTDVQDERWHIDGLRHILEPFADYQWVPSPNVNTNELFQFDTIRTLTITNSETIPLGRYLPLDFPAYNEIDAITREDTLRFGLRQRLQTQRDGQPWDLVDLTFWTDWHIEQNHGEQEFADLYGTLDLRPVEWFAFRTTSRYDFQDGVLREFNTEALVHDGDRWSVGLGTRYLKDDSNIVSVNASWRLSRQWVAQVYERVDMQDGLWEEQDYVLRQELHDWYIGYGFRYLSHQQGGDERALFVTVTLKSFPASPVAVNR